MSTKSQSQHILELSRELLDDIELGRLEADKLLLKCSRLARLAGSEKLQRWISFEMMGYSRNDPLALEYMTRTGRWVDYEKKRGFWGPLAQQEAVIKAEQTRLISLKLPNTTESFAIATRVFDTISEAKNRITTLSGVKSRVLALLHGFISEVYYEREFAALAESTFERYKKEVDLKIAAHAGDVLSKIPAVIDRLSEGSEEGVSQALSTCRRILEAFADAIYPPTDATIELGGNTLKLDASKHQNRINAYIAGKTESVSRRQKLRQNLSNLFDRVSTGVHRDVTAEEAYSLFLNTYLFLGEVLHLAIPLKAEPH
jgi:AbiTii